MTHNKKEAGPQAIGACTPEERLELFTAASKQIASSADLPATLASVIESCLPLIADFGFVDARIGERVVRTARAFDDPETDAIIANTHWTRQERDDMNLCALSTGEPALHHDIDDAWYQKVAHDQAHLAALRQLAFRSMITVPLHFRGELLGALTLFMSKSGRRHGSEDLHFATQLAELSAPLVANARLFDAQRSAERALRVSEERLRLATEAGQLGIWDWQIEADEVSWSPRVAQLHGTEPSDRPLSVKDFFAVVHPQDLPELQRRLETTLQQGDTYEAEYRAMLPDEGTRWLAAKAKLFRNDKGEPERLIGATWDVTQRVELLAAERRARAEAQNANRHVATLAAASESLAQSLKPDDTVRAIASLVVPRFADWCRVDLVSSSGQVVHALSHHADPALARRGTAVADRWRSPATTPGSVDWVIATGQHSMIQIRPEDLNKIPDPQMAAFVKELQLSAMLSVPLIARGRIIGAVTALLCGQGRRFSEDDRALLQQLAQRAASALDNAQLYADAENARREAEAASRAKDEFLAVLGHELRNPLAPIVTALHLMGLRGDASTAKEQAIIKRQVTHMSRLVDDLLDVSRITQGKVELERKRISLRDVLTQVLDQVRASIEQRHQHLDAELPESALEVVADEVRLVQVFTNLLVNASKFSAAETRILLSAREEPDSLLVCVSDDGIGISAELLPRIFDLFVQGPQASDRRSGGLGIGLTLVRSLVLLHRGETWAESAGPGKGSRFYVRLPMASDADTPALGHEVPARGMALRGKIMVVDDNSDAGETISALLRGHGCDVRYAADGASALETASEFAPDMALLDIGLPGMDGYELARKLRTLPGLKSMPMVAVTGYGAASDKKLSHEAGFIEHLVKPVMPSALMAVVGRHMRPRAERQ